jgi:hypothetical protein
LTAGTVELVATGRVVGGAVSINVTGGASVVVSAGAVVTAATVGGAEVDPEVDASEQATQTPSNASASAATRLTST